MTRPSSRAIVSAALLFSITAVMAQSEARSDSWQKAFGIGNCKMSTQGRGQYFILEPGYRLVLKSDDTKLQVTVLDETKTVDGILTRVVEEREWKDGQLYEVSRNFFALCEGSNDAFYFGEEVDFYENGKVVKHEGSWLAGKDSAKAGMIMPGTPKVGQKYYQEVAPGIAMDRAEIVSLTETCETPAGTFAKCMKVKEGTALNILETEYKYHAPGIGLVRDEDLRLVQYGFVRSR